MTCGRTTGIYTSWAECKLQVEGFKGAQHHGFPTLKEAAAHMRLFKVSARLIPPPSFLEALSPADRVVWEGASVSEQHTLFQQTPPFAPPPPKPTSEDTDLSDTPNSSKKRKLDIQTDGMEADDDPPGDPGMGNGLGGAQKFPNSNTNSNPNTNTHTTNPNTNTNANPDSNPNPTTNTNANTRQNTNTDTLLNTKMIHNPNTRDSVVGSVDGGKSLVSVNGNSDTNSIQTDQPANPPRSFASVVGSSAKTATTATISRQLDTSRTGNQIPRRTLLKLIDMVTQVIDEVGGVFSGFSGDLFAPSHSHTIRPGLAFPGTPSLPAHLDIAKEKGSRFWALPPLFGQGALTNSECASVIDTAISGPNFRYGILVTPAPTITDILPPTKIKFYAGDIAKGLAEHATYRGSVTLTTPTTLLHLLPPTEDTPAEWAPINSPPLPLQFHFFIGGERTTPSHTFAQESPTSIVRIDENPMVLQEDRAGMFCLPGTVWGKGALKNIIIDHTPPELEYPIACLPFRGRIFVFPYRCREKFAQTWAPYFLFFPHSHKRFVCYRSKTPPKH